MWWTINTWDRKRFGLDDGIMLPAMERDGYGKGKPGTGDNPTSLDQILAVSAFNPVWTVLGLWQDLSLSSRAVTPSGLSSALISDFHINRNNIIEIVEVTFIESAIYIESYIYKKCNKFLPLYSFRQEESCR